jgi:Protein of unknown function (DUF3386)
MAIPINARELFQTAYASRYTWDENFPGYTADVELKQADAVYAGKIRINPDLIVEVTGIADEQVQGGILTQLTDLTIACQRINFEEVYDKYEFICGESDITDTVEILLKGDSMESKYQIRDREIYQISRTLGNTSAVFTYLQNFDTGEGYIRDRYDAIFRDVQTNQIIEHIKFTDSYDKIGKYYVMTHQVVQESPMTSTTEFKYLNIKLCEPVKV